MDNSTQANATRNLESIRCEHRLEMISKFKKGFGDDFDKLMFLNYTTGLVDVPGAALRDAQTGCEIYERLGWNSASHNSTGHFNCGCKQFDEQLLFVSDSGKALSNTDYCLTMCDSTKVRGKTDSEGKTRRIKSANKAKTIKKAELHAPPGVSYICPQNGFKEGACLKEVELANIETTRENIGSSVKTVTLEGKKRNLTSGEIAMLKPVFKNAIKYSDVKVKKGQWWMLLGLHGLFNNTTIITPDGNLYCPDDTFEEDFSVAKPNMQIWFLHEMTHVWQYQLGYFIKLMGVLTGVRGGYLKERVYKYDATQLARGLRDYNFEQQAEIISHYWAAKSLKHPTYIKYMPFFEQVLDVFLQTPGNSSLLPRD